MHVGLGCREFLEKGASMKKRKETTPEEPKESIGIVTRYVRNPRLILARVDEKEVRVRVSNFKLFRIGMEIPIKKLATDDVWMLTRKEPRSPGRW
jgi:hypothetical protein